MRLRPRVVDRWVLGLAGLCGLALPPVLPIASVARAVDAEVDPAARSAIYLLRQSTTVQRNGRQRGLLMGLRRLQDPTLRPLFSELAASSEPPLKVHGILGLAELSKDGQVALERIAEIDSPAAQAEVVTVAMDTDMLNGEVAAQILAWEGVDVGVKVVIATRLTETGDFEDVKLLQSLMEQATIGRRGLLGLLLAEMGHPSGMVQLQELDESKDPKRDQVRSALLQTADRHHFTSAGTWAFATCREPDVDPALARLALRTAMRLGNPLAAELWRQRYLSETEPAHRIRLARTALEQSPWLAPDLFETLLSSSDELIVQMGHTGIAIASRARDVPDQVVALIQLQHPLCNLWALEFATKHAKPADAQVILMSLILASKQNPQKQPFRLAVVATSRLFDLDLGAASMQLRPILASPNTDLRLVNSILLGLLRSESPHTHTVLRGLPHFKSLDANNLAILLKAMGGEALDENQIKDLQLLVRGTVLEDSLRIQAAWSYLKHTNQVEAALAAVSRP